MKKRSVPARNLIELDTVTEEDMGRQEYEREIAGPIRDFLLSQDPEGRKFRCIVLMYGIPLRVGPPTPGEEEKRRISDLDKRRADLQQCASALCFARSISR
jgi:hypothetical protein